MFVCFFAMISKKALRRSSDAKITNKELRMADERSDMPREFLEIEAWCEAHAIQGIDLLNDAYHHKFTRFASPPSVIYRKGDISLLDRSLLAIV